MFDLALRLFVGSGRHVLSKMRPDQGSSWSCSQVSGVGWAV
jgi:hypothetical protein